MFRRILVASDLSDASRRALEAGIALGRLLDAEVTVLYVSVPVYPVNHWYVPHVGEDIATLRAIASREEEAARNKLDADVRALSGDRPPTILIKTGAAADVILEVAESSGADLIVVGTHGRHGVERLLIGSVADRVSRKARCSVLTVHPGPQP